MKRTEPQGPSPQALLIRAFKEVTGEHLMSQFASHTVAYALDRHSTVEGALIALTRCSLMEAMLAVDHAAQGWEAQHGTGLRR